MGALFLTKAVAADAAAAGAEKTTVTATAGIRIADADARMATAEDANALRKIPADAEMISVRNRVLNRDLLCSTRIQTADATNRKITTVTEKMCGKPHIFLCGKRHKIF